MKKKIFPLIFTAMVSLTACGGKTYSYKEHLSDYVIELPYKTGFNILQLTDIHISDKDDQDRVYDYIDTLVEDARNKYGVDLIVVTGDLFTFASRWTAQKFFDHLNSYGAYWTVVFGNHDEQTYFPVDWMTSYLTNYGKNCVFKDILQDDVEGNCNFVIHLMKDDKVQEQLIFMDSNRYHFGTDYSGYDYFKDKQISWYSDIVDYTKDINGSAEPAKSLMFYHIPLPEVNDAYEYGNDNEKIIYGEKREKSCPPDKDLGFFKVIDEKNATNGMFFGHDHVNNFEVVYNDVLFCYGLKSTDRLYHDDDMVGYKLISLNDDGSFEMKRTRISFDGKERHYE